MKVHFLLHFSIPHKKYKIQCFGLVDFKRSDFISWIFIFNCKLLLTIVFPEIKTLVSKIGRAHV